MKRAREQAEPIAASGSHPDAAKPLSAFRRISVSCNDCGEVTVLDEPQLAELSAVPTFGDLWRLAFCPACRASGVAGSNMDVRGESVRAAAAVEPAWSTKRVFDDNRKDPFPTLPRRTMFER